MPLPRALARFNRRVSNKLLGPLAYLTPPFALVVHVGRSTGREYRTPVWAFRTDDGFAIALTYGGAPTEWVKNVVVGGGATLITRGAKHELAHPRIVHGNEGLREMPSPIRPALHVLRVDDFLLLRDRP
jgi:deazaflavin-dependent oxidoreductase (nitroreductase family)